MSKNLWALAILSMGLLTACPSDNTEQKQTASEMNTASSPDTHAKTTNPLPHPDSIQLHFKQAGKDISVTAKPQKSEQVAYQIYLPAGFALTPEEPGKDIVTSDLSEISSMRIEVIADADAHTQANLNKAMQEGLRLSGQDSPIQTLTPQLPDTLQDALIQQTESEQMVITGMVFKQDNLWTRITIFSDKQAELSDELIQIAATIRQSAPKAQ